MRLRVRGSAALLPGQLGSTVSRVSPSLCARCGAVSLPGLALRLCRALPGFVQGVGPKGREALD